MISGKYFNSIFRRFNCEQKLFPTGLELKMIETCIFMTENKTPLQCMYHGNRMWSFLIAKKRECTPMPFLKMKDKIYDRIHNNGEMTKWAARRTVQSEIVKAGFYSSNNTRRNMDVYEKYMEIFRSRLNRVAPMNTLQFLFGVGRSCTYVMNGKPSIFSSFWGMGYRVSKEIRSIKKLAKIEKKNGKL